MKLVHMDERMSMYEKGRVDQIERLVRVETGMKNISEGMKRIENSLAHLIEREMDK